MLRPSLATARAYNAAAGSFDHTCAGSIVRAHGRPVCPRSLQCHGRLTRPLCHLNITADSDMYINKSEPPLRSCAARGMFSRLGRDKWIIRHPNKSGDIYLSLVLTCIVFVKRTITLVLHIFICRTIIRHNIGVTPCIWSAHWRHYILAFDHSALLNGRAQTACGPVYINTRPVLHLRRFTTPAADIRPHRFTTPWPTRP